MTALYILCSLILLSLLILCARTFLVKPPVPDTSAFEAKNEQLKKEFSDFRRETLDTLMKFNDSLLLSSSVQSDKQREALDRIRQTLDEKIAKMQEDNAKKLDAMRVTVDEKLQTTLEKRLTESFKLVGERLLSVQKGLGEMSKLATDVDRLQQLMNNVKTRGVFGEYLLENILSEILTPEQYVKNYNLPGKNGFVEFAVKLPGRSAAEQPVFLPIDSKFPREDYERLVNAAESGQAELCENARKELLKKVTLFANDIQKKYIQPPHTTNFAVMFLPTEGLYAEILREPGFHQKLRAEKQILVAGPSTLAALLNALSIGFRTLAVERRSAEVWKMLGAVKTQFIAFSHDLERAQKQAGTLLGSLESTHKRTEMMQRKLLQVESDSDTADEPTLQLDGDHSDQ